MNLLIAYPNKFRPSETFIKDQIEALMPKLTIYEGWYPSLNNEDHSFLRFPFNFLLFRGFFRRYLPNIYHKIYTKLLSNYLIENKISVVLAQYGPMGATLYDACKKSNVALVVHFHGFDANEKNTLKNYLPKYKKMFQEVKALIAVSQDMKNKLIEFGANPNTTFFNSCFVDTSKFIGCLTEKNEIIFTAVGRFTAKKSPQYTIKAFSMVNKKIPNSKLIMVGEGELFEESKRLAESLNLNSKIEFYGVGTPTEIIGILQKSRVFVQHSMFALNGDSEGTPVSILEASSSGLPIVSTKHAGIKDAVIHGETGFLVEEGDWEKMAEYMIELAQKPELAAQMGRRGREFMIKNYDKERQVQKLREILNN